MFRAAAIAALFAGAASAAPSTVIYRCTAPSGAVALQDDPCPPGHRQETREVAVFAPAVPAENANASANGSVDTGTTVATTRAPETAGAAPSDAAAAPAVITAADAPPSRPALLPPPLWRCTDLNGRSRLADVYDPQPRCVPLSVLGVDLSRAPPSAATLCRTVEDDCVELGGEAACAAWEERLDAAESALRSAFSDTQAERRRERDRAKAVVEDDCRG